MVFLGEGVGLDGKDEMTVRFAFCVVVVDVSYC